MSSYRQGRRVVRSNKRNLWSLVLWVALSAAIALPIAGVWQYVETRMLAPPGQSSQPESQSQPGVSDSQPPEESTPESKPEEPASPFAGAVPKSDWVDTKYFDDAVFLGDSLTNGIKVYDVMSNTTVISSTGISLENIFSKAVVKQEDGSYATMLEALGKTTPAKIYIMMGANSIGWDKETFLKYYARLLDAVAEQHPESILYVQSILPVTAKKEAEAPVFSNARIDEYNLALLALTQQKGMQFLYVAEAFKDETGALPDEASPKDGIHFGRSYYMKWFDYLRTHTVQP